MSTKNSYNDYNAWFDWWLSDEPPTQFDQVKLQQVHQQQLAQSAAQPLVASPWEEEGAPAESPQNNLKELVDAV